MELYLQMGFGMQALALEMISQWGGGKVILSPVNMPQDKMALYAQKVRNLKGEVIFDPQMFYPKEGHTKLKCFDYWPVEGASLASISSIKTTSIEIFKINSLIETNIIILPGMEMNETNFSYGLKITNEAANTLIGKTNKPLFATICLCSETVRNINAIEQLIGALKSLPVAGFYIVPHPANNEYLVSDALWVMGLLKLVTCLRLQKKQVILGYSSHQGLIFALANINAIASGTYMNTRSFEPTRFQSPKDDDIKHKSVWYYLPSAMNEYKKSHLDVAQKRGYLSKFVPQGDFANDNSAMLFRGATPSSTNYGEPNSFRHYLHCLKIQSDMLNHENYLTTFSKYDLMLSSAEIQMRELKKLGMSGYNRDFSTALEANRMAMYANNTDYGLKLKFEWKRM